MRGGCLILWALVALPALIFGLFWSYLEGCLFRCADAGLRDWQVYFSEPLNLAVWAIFLGPPMICGVSLLIERSKEIGDDAS